MRRARRCPESVSGVGSHGAPLREPFVAGASIEDTLHSEPRNAYRIHLSGGRVTRKGNFASALAWAGPFVGFAAVLGAALQVIIIDQC